MTAHPNAHIFAQLAEIAKTDPKPWKRLEMKTMAGDWISCDYSDDPLLNPRVTFHIKPTTVNIGGVKLEGPLREAPEETLGSGYCLTTHLRRMRPSYLPDDSQDIPSGSTKGVSLLPKKPETNTRTHWRNLPTERPIENEHECRCGKPELACAATQR